MGLFKKKIKKIDNAIPINEQPPTLPPLPQGYIPQQINQAMIISVEMIEDGEYEYKVVTNYQLNLGNCILTQ